MALKTAKLIEPYGKSLVNLLVSEKDHSLLKKSSTELDSLTLSERALYDLEMLAIGAFSPLRGFMDREDYESVLETMRLQDGTLFPIPITLPVHKRYPRGKKLALRDGFGNLLAVMTVQDCYSWDRVRYAEKILGTRDEAHMLVDEMKSWGHYNIAGAIQVLALPQYRDFADLRLTPAQTRQKLAQLGTSNVVAFQTRNPLHRAHEELTKRASSIVNGTLLIHPVVGMTKPGDIGCTTRVLCYKVLLDNYYNGYGSVLGLLPLAMRMAGPREALWHAIIRRNYGANHFIVGRDHAGPGRDSMGRSFYGPYEAQELVKQYEDELKMTILTFNEMVYIADDDCYDEAHKVPAGKRVFSLSGTQVREDYLSKGRPLPTWFTRPEVGAILADAYLPLTKRGFCLWFTGLSGAGKSTLARAVEARLHEQGRQTTMLDGDIVRNSLSRGLGFSKEDREANIYRIGFVAAQIVHHHGVAICALISPYEEARQRVRNAFSKTSFIEIYVSTPLQVCESRDPKGHYAKIQKGRMKNFTGVDDVYEPPTNPDIVIDTSNATISESMEIVLAELRRRGFIQS